jgi:hypothetical protein
MKHILCPLQKAYREFGYKTAFIPDLSTRQKFVVPFLGLVFCVAIPRGVINRYHQFGESASFIFRVVTSHFYLKMQIAGSSETLLPIY